MNALLWWLLLLTQDSDSSTLESQSDISSMEDESPEPYNLTVEELLEERLAQFDATLVALNVELYEMEAAVNRSAQLHLISKPMASKLAYTLLHPSLYRLVKGVGQSIAGLVQMATQLKAANLLSYAQEEFVLIRVSKDSDGQWDMDLEATPMMQQFKQNYEKAFNLNQRNVRSFEYECTASQQTDMWTSPLVLLAILLNYQ
ncbi:hypothetical protein MP228_009200 [Amoeboaphelidium protococcarum]|nr:hypothetical protein MP228_009200 [Amoeboaphelidium protococcarum]